MSAIGEVNEKEFVIEWKVYDFFSIPEDADKSYSSPVFSFADSLWRLYMYPNGQKCNKSEGCVVITLGRLSAIPAINLRFSLGLKKFNNKIAQEKHFKWVFNQEKMCGSFNSLKRSALLEQKWELAPSGHLIWVCRMKCPETVDGPSENSTSGFVILSKIAEDLKRLLLTQENCDVILKVKEKDFPAHKAILSARSSVFAATFRNDMKEKETGVVDIEDCDSSTFPVFLRFLYSEDTEGLSVENVFSIFSTADKYDVADLRAICLELMKENLSIDTFCDTLTLALRHSENDLIRSAADFFVAHAGKITTSIAWQSFIVENPLQANELVIKFIASVQDGTIVPSQEKSCISY